MPFTDSRNCEYLCKQITVAKADAFKTVLEANRYVMPFATFAENL
jgi:hypothetical protein